MQFLCYVFHSKFYKLRWNYAYRKLKQNENGTEQKEKHSKKMEYIIKLITIEKKLYLIMQGKKTSAPRVFQDKYKKKQTSLL